MIGPLLFFVRKTRRIMDGSLILYWRKIKNDEYIYVGSYDRYPDKTT